MYDSKNDTLEHIKNVRKYIDFCIGVLEYKAQIHDESKLIEPEKEIFDIYTPKLKNSTYGSDEYKQFLEEMKVALDHHYKKNRHHPEHFENGINDMNLIDLVEMLCDWKAASKRHLDGDIYKSIEMNKNRFNYSDQLEKIFKNTINLLEGIE